ncbi:LOW QUALITY PROTEIN: hypothetical protein JCM19039_3821 [Geomicrobium sp. JCM 19039]|nr:LOW QUALITY PROTEIN: hypothetical protein JCM19039_3821 [Geomicrobium sp. JCM 19039]
MSLKHVLEMYELLDDIEVNGGKVEEYIRKIHPTAAEITVKTITGEKGCHGFVRIVVPGTNGKENGGAARRLEVIGRLVGLGRRPEMKGFVSDGDGALAALAAAAKLTSMTQKGDELDGDVIFTTHICPTAPTQPHDPVPFMGSPVGIHTMNAFEVDKEMDAILSIDTTKGNRIINHRGFAITPTIKEGYILRVSEALLDVYTQSAGKLPVTLPVTIQDITPYGNGVYHINSFLQPAVATDKPVVGVAITTETAVAGCGTGATHVTDIDDVVRFSLEVAKRYGNGQCELYNADEFQRLTSMYGSLSHLQNVKSEANV